MSDTRGSMLTAFVVVVLMVFLVAVYLVVAVPTLDQTADQLKQADRDDSMQRTNVDDEFAWVLDVAMLLVPTIFVVGVPAYLYAVVTGRGSFRGAGPR